MNNEDKKEEIYSIAKTNYILGQTDERSQWYKKINEKIKEIDEYKDTEYYSPPIYKTKKGIEILKEDAMLILEELIGKEE